MRDSRSAAETVLGVVFSCISPWEITQTRDQMSEATPLSLNPDVVHTTLSGGQAVLLHMRTHKYYSLNKTGSRVWSLLESGESVEKISEQIAKDFGIDSERASRDVASLIEALKSAGLVNAA
jgi:hypothetical protein